MEGRKKKRWNREITWAVDYLFPIVILDEPVIALYARIFSWIKGRLPYVPLKGFATAVPHWLGEQASYLPLSMRACGKISRRFFSSPTKAMFTLAFTYLWMFDFADLFVY